MPPVDIAAGFGLNYAGVRLAQLDGDGKPYFSASAFATLSRLGPFSVDIQSMQVGRLYQIGGGQMANDGPSRTDRLPLGGS